MKQIGAIINILAHQYMHSLPRNQEEIINDYIREWKKFFYKEVKVIRDIEIDELFKINQAEVTFNEKGKMLTKQDLIERQRRKEEREFQKIRKEIEDR